MNFSQNLTKIERVRLNIRVASWCAIGLAVNMSVGLYEYKEFIISICFWGMLAFGFLAFVEYRRSYNSIPTDLQVDLSPLPRIDRNALSSGVKRAIAGFAGAIIIMGAATGIGVFVTTQYHLPKDWIVIPISLSSIPVFVIMWRMLGPREDGGAFKRFVQVNNFIFHDEDSSYHPAQFQEPRSIPWLIGSYLENARIRHFWSLTGQYAAHPFSINLVQQANRPYVDTPTLTYTTYIIRLRNIHNDDRYLDTILAPYYATCRYSGQGELLIHAGTSAVLHDQRTYGWLFKIIDTVVATSK